MATPADTLEIGYSPLSMIGLILIGIGMIVLSVLVAFRILPNVRAGSFQEFAGFAGILFFSAATGLAVWRMVSSQEPILTLTNSGIRDIRIAPEEIPWSAIKAVSMAAVGRQRFLVLSVDPSAEKQLQLTRAARWSRPANRRLGIDGLCVTAQGLKINYRTLNQICDDRIRRAHGIMSTI